MECNGCTLCCLVLPVPWMNNKAGEWCKHCNIGVGCKLWDNGITDDCAKFQCIYNEVTNLPIELRPDKCKVIFENVGDNIILGTMHPEYREAYKKRIIRNQVEILLKKGRSVVFNSFTADKAIIFPTKRRQMSEIWSTLQTKWKEKNDSTSIHN